MDTAPLLNFYVLEEPFDSALKLIRSALGSMELIVLGELDVPARLHPGPGPLPHSKILLVDCPVLDGEALALDRAAAMFLPLHVLVSAAGSRTRVSVMNPAGVFDSHLASGAFGPLDRLVSRVAMALESLVEERA